MNWTSQLIDRLTDGADSQGAWGYRPGTPPCAEPTALACLALACHSAAPERWRPALSWLRSLQRPNGRVPLTAQAETPGWATGLAVLAWQCQRAEADPVGGDHVKRAVDWLLNTRGIPGPVSDLVGHDTQLRAWPWVDGTHSWVEPTSCAILALRAVGVASCDRVRQGVKLLLDRVLPHGGWNYGNKRVFGHTLRPFPATTGIALSALAGEPVDDLVKPSLAYLGEILPTLRAPRSLAWGLIGLTAWRARPEQADEWLDCAAARRGLGQPDTLHDALMLLAGVPAHPFLRATRGENHA